MHRPGRLPAPSCLGPSRRRPRQRQLPGSAAPQALPGALRATFPGMDTRWSARTTHKHTGTPRAILPSQEEMLHQRRAGRAALPEALRRDAPGAVPALGAAVSPQPLALTARSSSSSSSSAAQPGLRGRTEAEASDGSTAPGTAQPGRSGGSPAGGCQRLHPTGIWSGRAEPEPSHSSAVIDYRGAAFQVPAWVLGMLPQPPQRRERMQSPEDAARQQNRIHLQPSHAHRALFVLKSPPGVQQKGKMQQEPPRAAP